MAFPHSAQIYITAPLLWPYWKQAALPGRKLLHFLESVAAEDLLDPDPGHLAARSTPTSTGQWLAFASRRMVSPARAGSDRSIRLVPSAGSAPGSHAGQVAARGPSGGLRSDTQRNSDRGRWLQTLGAVAEVRNCWMGRQRLWRRQEGIWSEPRLPLRSTPVLNVQAPPAGQSRAVLPP